MISTALIGHEIRDAARKRWLWVYIASFAILSGLLARSGIAGLGIAGVAGFGPAAAGLINLNLVVVPLIALVAGALTFARDRESGALGYALSLPVRLRELFVAKVLGLGAALMAAVIAGFGAAVTMAAILGASGDLSALAATMGLTLLLAWTMGAIGILISCGCRSVPVALGLAIAAWLLFTVLGDLGLMATSMATNLGVRGLLFATLANPVEAYKISAVAALSGSVDVLGPGGRLATDIFGQWLMPVLSAVLVTWLLAATALAWLILKRRDAV